MASKGLSKRQAVRILNKLSRTLDKGGENARYVWAILAALRGPDSSNERVKEHSTAMIRSFLVDHEDKPSGTLESLVVHEFNSYQFHRYPDASEHFNSHITSAFEALVALGFIEHEEAKRTRDNIVHRAIEAKLHARQVEHLSEINQKDKQLEDTRKALATANQDAEFYKQEYIKLKG